MNELITNGFITVRNENGKATVSARELHEWLKTETPFRKWFPRMCEYSFEEGVDYTLDIFVHPLNGQDTADYRLTASMGKEISMLQRTDLGKQARLYFMRIEDADTGEAAQGPEGEKGEKGDQGGYAAVDQTITAGSANPASSAAVADYVYQQVGAALEASY